MAEKNLHDIKIDELDSPKKTPLKNILTLLALLFIILVISVVITKLILSTDDGKELDKDKKGTIVSTEINNDANTTTKEKNSSVAIPIISNIPERNLTSRTKTPLRTHEPVKAVKEVTEKTPTKSKTPKHTTTKHTTTKAPKHPSVTKHSSTPKKEYIDKVVVKKAPKKVVTKTPSYLGGKREKLSSSYYIQVGSYKNTETILSKIKKQNFNYSLQNLNGKAELTRVFVGPFFSQNQAEKNLAKVKAHILKGAYVKKVKP